MHRMARWSLWVMALAGVVGVIGAVLLYLSTRSLAELQELRDAMIRSEQEGNWDREFIAFQRKHEAFAERLPTFSNREKALFYLTRGTWYVRVKDRTSKKGVISGPQRSVRAAFHDRAALATRSRRDGT